MFVVRLIGDNWTSDFKAFERRADAEKRFWAGWFHVEGIDGASSALFEVPGVSHAEAVQAVKAARADVNLLELKPEPLDLEGIDL